MTTARSASGKSKADDDAMEAVKALEGHTNSLSIRLEELEKRVSDARTYVGWTLGSVGLLISTITIVSGLKYSGEIDRLTEFKKELEARVEKKVNESIGKIEDKSKLTFLPIDKEDFDREPISAKLTDDDFFRFTIQIQNIGESLATITFLKLYTKKDLPLIEFNRGSDVQGFSFSRAYTLRDIHIINIPPGAAAQYEFSAKLAEGVKSEQILDKKFTVLAAVYYGKIAKHEQKIEIIINR